MSGTAEDVHRPSRDIPSMVQECQIEFANLAAAQGCSRSPWIRSAQGNFNLWITGIRASSYDKSSLTYRLRLDKWSGMREDICDLLKGICDTLIRVQQLKDASTVDNNSISTDIDSINHTEDEGPSSPDSWEVMSRESGGASSDSASIDSNSSLSECISNIHVMLDQLMRITLLIRKSGNRTRFEDIDSGYDESEYLDFRQLLTTIILRAHSGLTGLEDTENVSAFEMMKHSSDQDQSRLNLVQLRLVRANMLRRHRFNIFRAKWSELFAEERNAPTTTGIDAQENMHTPDLSDSNSEAAPSTHQSAKPHLDREVSAISRASGLAQTATEPGSSLNIDHIVNPEAKSAATKMTHIGSSQEYPRVPQFENGTASLCPYCYEQLPRKVTESDDESMWKAHLVRDIIPYTCIVDSCSIPDEMYLTAESLLAHMIDTHSIPRWSCDYCALESPTSDNPEYHQFQIFETATDWIVHFAQRHNKENLAMTDIATLAELNRRQMFKALTCPLCHELKVDTEAMDYKIDDHVLSHLHEFSLLSLPETHWDTEKTTRSTSQASGILSHITPIDRYPTLSPRVAEINLSLSQLQTTMKQAWPLVRSDQSQQIPDLIEQDHQSNTAQVELSEKMALATLSPPASSFQTLKSGRRARARLSEPSLRDRIPGFFARSDFDAQIQSFLPEPLMKELIIRSAIEKELQKDPTFRDTEELIREELLEWIATKGRKLFAITLECDPNPPHLLEAMYQFSEAGFDDDDLPIEQPTPPPSALPLPRPAGFADSDLWTISKYYAFYRVQWTYLSPIFRPDKYVYNEYPECIFPFTVDDAVPKAGAFSFVYKVRIHYHHQKNDKLREVAIKEIKTTRGNDKSGTDDAWEQEARALSNINALDHDHITKCIAAIRRGDSRYFMFPWADGDSLRDYWDMKPKPDPNPQIVLQTLQQLRGLADALDRLHHCDSGTTEVVVNEDDQERTLNVPDMQVTDEHDQMTDHIVTTNKKFIRHGDLKPENILRFMEGGKGLGMLKIADMGLAKQHIVKTRDRTHLTSTRYGTIRYEAPEAVTAIRGGRSRLYDIWSMGCITLEFIIWILYGNDQLNNFYDQVKGDAKQVCQYFEILETGELRRPQVHHVVLQWINHIENTDPECAQDSAIRDLLRLVREKLLVVPLPPNRASSLSAGPVLVQPGIGETVTRYRATADEFRDALDKILSRVDEPNYLFTANKRENTKPPLPRSSMLGTPAPGRIDSVIPIRATPPAVPSQSPMLTGVLGQPIRTDYTLPPLKDWDFPVDNMFAETVSACVGPQSFLPTTDTPATLCTRCSSLDLWEGGFALPDRRSVLKERAAMCELCSMLYDVSASHESQREDGVVFERKQSNLIIQGDLFPALSIFRSPGLRTPTDVIQLGFPDLLEPGTPEFFALLRLWLEDCSSLRDTRDVSHKACHAIGSESLPTRLIDVGTLEEPILRLVETSHEELANVRYIALSHPWGDTTQYVPFSTLRNNVDAFKVAIPYEQLPATFKDAVICTRNLNIRYIWVDSICIIQGKDGDFNEEATRMEDVFSGAFCVLAASRASNQHDGFLKPRAKQQFITMKRTDQKPFYVCENINNFSKDVIDGSLNKRGWVLQERALARRTIYFTASQTYFECGEGIRCETLTKMRNNMADFLGDPNFPDKAMRAKRGERIAYFQGLYRQYSRLNFTRYEDRPYAIAGLEKRLQKAFGTQGAFGIFDDGDDPNGGLFHRSLLWQRGEEEEDDKCLTPIDFPPERHVSVPTWSWMAYKGGIDYMDPPFQSADWETQELIPPWTRGGALLTATDSAPPDGQVAIEATVRNFSVAGRREHETKFSYDTEKTTASDGQRAQCVIVAKARDSRSDRDRRYYVLLVTPVQGTTGRGLKVYERVGVGYMLGKFIQLDGEGTRAKII